jgi:hypothetical protein
LSYTNCVRTISLRRQQCAVRGPLLAALAAFSIFPAAISQEPAKKPWEPPAFRLPDGTIVVYASPGVELIPNSVRLSAKEYAALVERADQATRESKPHIPSECRIGVAVEARGERSLAIVTLTYRFKTNNPRTTVLLGGRELFPTAARFANGELPVLSAMDGGFTVIAERPGEHELTLTAEASVTVRSPRNETGIEFGLPGTVVTSLRMSSPFSGSTGVTVATRSQAGPVESRRVDIVRLTPSADRPHGLPLGAITQLELSWDAPNAAAGRTAAAEFEIGVRIEDTAIDTVMRIRLNGPQRTWSLTLPIDARVTVERASGPKATQADPSAQATSTGTAANPIWTVTVPDGGEWLVTAQHRRIRPTKTAPDYAGPYPVGPLSVANVFRQTGTIRCYAPAGVRLAASHGSEIRPADPIPAAAGEEAPSVAFFARTTPAAPPNAPAPPLLTLDVRPALPVVQVRPTHRLRLTEAGWHLRSDLRVTPVHQELSQLAIDVPIGWGAIDVTPADLVEGVQPVGDTGTTRRLAVRLTAPRKDPFDIVLEAIVPLPSGPRPQPMTIPLPRVIGTVERDARLTASVPEGWEIKGAVRDGDAGTPGSRLVDLTGDVAGGRGPTTSVSAVCDRVAASVALSWQPYRPELTASLSADVTIGERQLIVTETVTLTAAIPIERTIRLRGPVNAAGLRATPALTPTGAGEYALTLPADKKTVVQSISYAVPLPVRTGEPEVAIGLFWPEDATHVHATARVWGPAGKRIVNLAGPWRDEPSTVPADRDSWPWLAVSATRQAGENVPALAVTLADFDRPELSETVIERADFLVTLTEGAGTHLRVRYWLSRWPGGGIDLDLPRDIACECFVDGRRIQTIPKDGPDGNPGTVRIPMPEARPGRNPALVELRLTAPEWNGEARNALPMIVRSTWRTPPQWSVWGPRSKVVLDLTGAFTSDVHWTWKGFPTGFSPLPPARTSDGSGEEPDPATNGLTPLLTGHLRHTPGTMPRLTTVPLPAWMLAWSAVAALAGWACLRAGRNRIGMIAASFGILFAFAIGMRPQMTALALAAMQPGIAAFTVAVALVVLLRWWQARAGRRLPAFGPRDASTVTLAVRPAEIAAESRSKATPVPLSSPSGATP